MAVTTEELRKARGIVAELAIANPILEPIFDRLDRELQARLERQETPLQKAARRQQEIRALA